MSTSTAPLVARAAPTESARTIYDVLRSFAQSRAACDAIIAPNAPSLRAGRLRLVDDTVAALRWHGVATNTTVALVAANGPMAATAFLGVACTARCAPLNPAYGAEELRFYLRDLGASMLVVDPALASPAVAVARELGVPVLHLEAQRHAAGAFTLAADGVRPAEAFTVDAGSAAEPRSDDVALVLHTSGTTSRPKLVPLSHANLCASAHHVASSLALGPTDRCLNVMPLFHIHGLVAALLATLDAGGSVACTSGLDATSFAGWLHALEPTWYTAVPTMHQAILAALGDGDAWVGHRLRFVRSSSAALPAPVLHRLERTFGVPVVEAYGMTEAAHQMTCNPLPPAVRKPGSVGVAAGPEVAIMDEAGALLAPDAIGEIVVRGPNVTAGYLANAEANARGFTHGWFRTGDQGRIDGDGYLHITGRLKEIINRGGEKVAPAEVDAVLLTHPDIAQAVTFASPHAELGEDVAAAVVPRAGASLRASELRAFVAARLAPFKVPRDVHVLDRLPLGATGKVQRIGLAERLTALGSVPLASADDEERAAHAAPATAMEEIVAHVWATVLDRDDVGVDDDFVALGGTSLRAQIVVNELERSLHVPLPLARFLAGTPGPHGPRITIRGTASMLDALVAAAEVAER